DLTEVHSRVETTVRPTPRASLELAGGRHPVEANDDGADVPADVDDRMLARHRVPARVRVGHWSSHLIEYPDFGVPTYGQAGSSVRPGLPYVRSSIALAAPSGVKVLSTNGIVRPATARSSIVTMSSVNLRPLGNPARSPPRMPNRFGEPDGGMATLSRSRSD